MSQGPLEKSVSTAKVVAKHMCSGASNTTKCGYAALSPITAACLVPIAILRYLGVHTADDEFLMTDPASSGTRIFRMDVECDLLRLRMSRDCMLAVAITTTAVATGAFTSASPKSSGLVSLLHMVRWYADDKRAEFVGPALLKEKRRGLFISVVLSNVSVGLQMPLECVGKASVCVDHLEYGSSGPDISQFRRVGLSLINCETAVMRLLEHSSQSIFGDSYIQRTCASCHAPDTRAVPHKCCAKCMKVKEGTQAFYCGSACQRANWPTHKKVHKTCS